jgi:Stress responsive A/B Barrel Domain
MVKHLVMWRLQEPVDAVGGDANWTRMNQALDAMRVGIAGLKRIEIGVHAGAAGDASDMALYSEFDSWEALRAYDLHPLHEVLKRIIGPMRTEKRVVDYEI